MLRINIHVERSGNARVRLYDGSGNLRVRSSTFLRTFSSASASVRIGVERNSVFIHGDAGAIENLLRFLAVDFFWAEIDQHQMIIGAAGNDAVTMLGQTGGERFCVNDDLSLIFAELCLQRFVETDGFRSDNVHERSALDTGKNGGVDLFRELLLAHDDPAARSA